MEPVILVSGRWGLINISMAFHMPGKLMLYLILENYMNSDSILP
jgi:hypothetical protein